MNDALRTRVCRSCASLWRAGILLVCVETLVGLQASPFAKIALLQPAQIDEKQLSRFKQEDFTGVALALTDTNAAMVTGAAQRIVAQGLELDYWIEIARNSAMADAHPEWMASIQTHEEWRSRFPQFSPCPSNAVVKVYPWVPLLSQEAYHAHLDRVAKLLRDQPAPRRLFLNDLQGAPSACGCGHPLCRWTLDYGPLKSATRLPDNAAAEFLAAVKRVCGREVIPIWTTECEQADRDTVCGGVGCFSGACWREWTVQLTPVTSTTSLVGVLLLYRAFDRDLPRYGKPAGWITSALESFQTMPARYQAERVPTSRLLPVVQGWDVTPEQIQAQIARAAEAGSAGVIVALTPIDQSWSPRIFDLRRGLRSRDHAETP